MFPLICQDIMPGTCTNNVSLANFTLLHYMILPVKLWFEGSVRPFFGQCMTVGRDRREGQQKDGPGELCAASVQAESAEGQGSALAGG